MASCHQNALFAAMLRPGFYPHPVDPIQKRETHISTVFLTGAFAYKIKKPLNLGFLDFTSLKQRHRFCNREVALNRRLSEGVYLGVVPLTWEGSRYCMGGPGKVVEFAVKMRQLPESRAMDALMGQGRLDAHMIRALAERLAGFYQSARSAWRIDQLGAWETVAANCEENFIQTEPFAGSILDRGPFETVRRATRDFLEFQRPLFERRVQEGRIRDCHGDLRTDHIYFLDRIQVIDCIEFNERFRFSDVAADLAFLAMEMDFMGRGADARQLLTHLVEINHDWGMFAMLDFYKCYRAFVRCKVTCFLLEQCQPNDPRRSALKRRATTYLQLAGGYAAGFSRPTVYLVGGLPATGKSTVAAHLAGALGLDVVQSDAVRKALFGLSADTPALAAFNEGIYSPDASEQTYARLLEMARDALSEKRSLVLDATWCRAGRRRAAWNLAAAMNAFFVLIWCECNESIQAARLKAREGERGISDARLSHLAEIRGASQQPAEIPAEFRLRLDTAPPLETLLPRIFTFTRRIPYNRIG